MLPLLISLSTQIRLLRSFPVLDFSPGQTREVLVSHGCRINYLFPKVINMVPELAILEKLMSNRLRSGWVGENLADES